MLISAQLSQAMPSQTRRKSCIYFLVPIANEFCTVNICPLILLFLQLVPSCLIVYDSQFVKLSCCFFFSPDLNNMFFQRNEHESDKPCLSYQDLGCNYLYYQDGKLMPPNCICVYRDCKKKSYPGAFQCCEIAHPLHLSHSSPLSHTTWRCTPPGDIIR